MIRIKLFGLFIAFALLALVRPKKCLELLEAADAGAAPERLPIATAPRDGTNIRLFFGQDGVSQGKYVAGLPHPWQFIDTNDGITWLINHAVDAPGGPSHWAPMEVKRHECPLPPAGWRCTRRAGHEGPCAAVVK